jgi:pyrroloquinoline quinone biosynthesis protein E
MLDEARRLNFVSYVVFGGEPLIRPDILEILQHSHDLGFYTSIITNGLCLPEKVEAIAKLVDLTWVSLDHNTGYHDEMRGRKGVFNRALEGIVKLKKAGGRTAINCVLSRLNMGAVEKMLKLTGRLGVKIAFDPIEVFPGTNEEYALMASERRSLFSEVLKFKKQGYPILNSYGFLKHLVGHASYSCAQFRIFLRVSEDGKIKPFWCNRTSKVLGDLRRHSLSEVLHSSSFRKLAEITEGCNLCNNSSTVESSLFYSTKNSLKNPLKFILNYAL